MPITYTIDREAKLITEVWDGEVDAKCLEEHWKQYLEEPEVLAIRRTIVDLRRAKIIFKGTVMDALIERIVMPALKGLTWKSAIVIDNSLQFGVSRQYQVFADRYSKDSIFTDIEEARNWLLFPQA